MADVEAAFVQQTHDIAKREREPDVQPQPSEWPRKTSEVAKGDAFCHGAKLGHRPALPVSSRHLLTVPTKHLVAGHKAFNKLLYRWDEYSAVFTTI